MLLHLQINYGALLYGAYKDQDKNPVDALDNFLLPYDITDLHCERLMSETTIYDPDQKFSSLLSLIRHPRCRFLYAATSATHIWNVEKEEEEEENGTWNFTERTFVCAYNGPNCPIPYIWYHVSSGGHCMIHTKKQHGMPPVCVIMERHTRFGSLLPIQYGEKEKSVLIYLTCVEKDDDKKGSCIVTLDRGKTTKGGHEPFLLLVTCGKQMRMQVCTTTVEEKEKLLIVYHMPFKSFSF